jgi:hypothetical protein
VEVFLLGTPSNGDTRGEERDVPNKCKADSETWKMRERFPIKVSSEVEKLLF